MKLAALLLLLASFTFYIVVKRDTMLLADGDTLVSRSLRWNTLDPADAWLGFRVWPWNLWTAYVTQCREEP